MAIAPATARRWWMQSWEFSSAIFLVLVSVRFLGYRFAENGRPPFAVDGATGFFQVLGDLVPNSEFWGVMVLTGAGISVATIFAPVGWRVVGWYEEREDILRRREHLTEAEMHRLGDTNNEYTRERRKLDEEWREIIKRGPMMGLAFIVGFLFVVGILPWRGDT